MTNAKNAVSETPAVISQMADVPKQRRIRKYVIIAFTAILSVTIVLTAILVGMYLFTQGQKDILKFTLNVNKDAKEEVTVDQNENVIQYHVQTANYEMWVVDDFNRDIELMKIQTDADTNCYIVPLNRTNAADPSKVKAPSNVDIQQNVTDEVIYIVASNPISDSSFLNKRAKELCKGNSVYWMYPRCSEAPNTMKRQKRTAICFPSFCPLCPFKHCICQRICYDIREVPRYPVIPRPDPPPEVRPPINQRPIYQ